MPDNAMNVSTIVEDRTPGIGDNHGPNFADLLRDELMSAPPEARAAQVEAVLTMLVGVAITEPQDVVDGRTPVKDALTVWAGRPKIENEQRAGAAANLTVALTNTLKVVEASRKAAKTPFDNAGKRVQAHFQGVAAPFEDGKASILSKVDAYQKEEARKRREAEEKARRDALEAERQREEAERKLREAEEQAALEEQARLAAQQSPMALINGQSEAERRAEEAAREKRETELAEARHQQEVAERRAEEAAQQAAQRQTEAAGPVRVVSAHGAMVTSRKTVGFRVTDLSKVPRHLLMLNEAAVKAHAKATAKGQLPAPVEGIEFFWNETPVGR